MRKRVIKTTLKPSNVSEGVEKELFAERSFMMNTIQKWELLMEKCFQVQITKQRCGAQKKSGWMLRQSVKNVEAVKWQWLIGSPFFYSIVSNWTVG